MKALKDFVDEAENYGRGDIATIKLYLSQPEIIETVPQILTDLLQRKIREYESFKQVQEMWQSIPTSYYYREHPIDVAAQFDGMTRRIILGEQLSDEDLRWLRENAPSIKLGAAFFQPLLREIHRNGIYFKGEKKEDNNGRKTLEARRRSI